MCKLREEGIFIYYSISNMKIYELIIFFFIYSFAGWVTEVIYSYKTKHILVNRGFLYGPYCPIYGTGIISIVLLLDNFRYNFFLLYIFSVILVSAIEYFTGFILEKCFNTKWWDYSKEPYNLHGRICLHFSLIWGVAALLVVKILNPLISAGLSYIPVYIQVLMAYFTVALFLLDFIFTLASLAKFSKVLSKLQSISSELKERYEYVISSTKDIAVDAAQNLESNIKELRGKYDKAFENLDFNHRRLLNAFPNLKPSRFDNILKEVKEKLNSLRRKI